MNKYQNLDSDCPSLSLFGKRMLQNYAQQATPNNYPPATRLPRLVRIFSEPWEKKFA